MTNIKAAIFDLDGTLVNTLDDLSNAMNYALAQLNQPTHTTEKCRTFIGNGVKNFARRALAPDKQHLRDELLEQMKQRYRDKCFQNSYLYDGIYDLIQVLLSENIRLAVATNKDQDVAKIIVEHFFGDAFDHIIGINDQRPIKPDPAGTFEILNATKVDPKDALFVGDSDVDIETASNAGIKSVGVTWGFRSREDLVNAGANLIIDHPSEIIQLTA